ncbi:striated muscle preferentially expressed protein kinase, partial [Astyanax mexicanus]
AICFCSETTSSCNLLLGCQAPWCHGNVCTLDLLEVLEGRSARFDCKVSGSPPPRVTWTHSCFKDIQKSSHCTFVYDDQECSLVVLNAQLEDSGVYTCTAKNLAGEISCKAELTVHIGVFGKTDEENSLRV